MKQKIAQSKHWKRSWTQLLLISTLDLGRFPNSKGLLESMLPTTTRVLFDRNKPILKTWDMSWRCWRQRLVSTKRLFEIWTTSSAQANDHLLFRRPRWRIKWADTRIKSRSWIRRSGTSKLINRSSIVLLSLCRARTTPFRSPWTKETSFLTEKSGATAAKFLSSRE